MKLKLLMATTLLLGLPLTNGAQPPTASGLLNPFAHDPVMAYEDSVYHLYATGLGISELTSSDLEHWNIVPHPVMSVIPQWARDSVPGFDRHVWAPDIIRWNDTWYMAYSCSTFGRNTSAIGLMSNKKLSGPLPWLDEGCIVASRADRDNWNAIDPNFVVDDDGQPWLTYGSFWDGIQLVRLDSTLHVAAGERPTTIARRYSPNDSTAAPNPTSKYAGRNAIEAPFIFRHGGYYYLFVSHDYCCRGSKSNYKVVVGRSRNVAGPYVDAAGHPMLEGGGLLVIEGDHSQYEAAGHCAAYHINGTDYFFCHGYSLKQEGAALLVVRKITWTDDGWPCLTPLH